MSKPVGKKSIIKSVVLDVKRDSSVTSNIYNDILDIVLLCKIDEDPPNSSCSKIYLPVLASSYPEWYDKSLVDQALFERIQMADPPSQLIMPINGTSTIPNDIITENRCLYYLSGCYQRLLEKREYFKSVLHDTEMLLIDNSKTAIMVPSIYENQNLSEQWIGLLIESQDNRLICEYIARVNDELLSSPLTDEIQIFYKNVFDHIYKAIQPLDYFSNDLMTYISILTYLSKWPKLVQLIFEISNPKKQPNHSSASGRSYEDTLIGRLLSKSCLPSAPGKPYMFFNKPKLMSRNDIEKVQVTVWQPMRVYQDSLTNLFRIFVKDANARNDVLKWIGDCFDENYGKSEEWSSSDQLAAFLFVSDAFTINLNAILLDLAKPFAESYSLKLLKINPVYAVCRNQNVHLKGLYRKSSLINRQNETQDEKNPDLKFNFITEIFFMSHFCYSSSVRGLYRTLLKLAEEVTKNRDEYRKAVQSYGDDAENTKQLDEKYQNSLTAYWNAETVLNEPHLLEFSHALFTATCSWLVHLASLPASQSDVKSNEEEVIHMIKTLPLISKPNRQLSYIPEFIIENIIDFLKCLGRFNVQFFQSMGPSINEYIHLILVFMGDMTRLSNAHLRAGLAEALGVIVPNPQDQDDDKDQTLIRSLAGIVFQECRLIEHLPHALLDVFVSIELTGQGVAFNQKFQYRLPMYNTLQYLWKFDRYRIQMKNIASYAEDHIDDAEAPLFLRFINLLMNDANFLLDEGLTNMMRLKTCQNTKESDEWNTMTELQRQEIQNTLRNTRQYARYTNTMGIRTLTILNMITQDIQSIFRHATNCGRLAAMLNYFLKHLVGPKRRDLKVRDLNECLFDPPQFVSKIVDIYLNFSRYNEFCAAVSNDGMSYNEQLFPEAIKVLQKIQYPLEKIDQFLKLGERIENIAAEQKAIDAAYDDAPDEYLDPITSTLMNDPVMLPSSRQIIDRLTIARHLLSDQTDPFNRNPLRMQDVIPQVELKQAIEQWKVSRREQS